MIAGENRLFLKICDILISKVQFMGQDLSIIEVVVNVINAENVNLILRKGLVIWQKPVCKQTVNDIIL